MPAAVPVSVKMRVGHLDTHRMLDCAHAICSAGASELVVHARTKADGYKPPAYWERIAAVREMILAGNDHDREVALEKLLTKDEQVSELPRAIWHKDECDELLLKKLIEDHHKWTGSLRAREILDDWATARGKFVKVFPHEYKRALGEINAAKTKDETIAKAKAEKKSGKSVPAK